MTSEQKELLEFGKKQFEGKNYARAERVFVKLLRSGHRYADVLNMLGVIHHVEGKFNDAIHSFEESLAINPNYAEAILNLAILYNDLGQYPKAKALFGRIHKKEHKIDFNPILKSKIANLHAQVADTYRGAGRFEEAIEEYKKALKLCPTYSDIRTKLGVCYREKGHHELSIKELSDTVRKNPNYQNALIQLGVSYYTDGQKDRAFRAWKDILKKDPENEFALTYLRLGQESDLKAE